MELDTPGSEIVPTSTPDVIASEQPAHTETPTDTSLEDSVSQAVTTIPQILDESPWPMFGRDPQRTGRSPYTGPEIPQLKWTYSLGGYPLSSPAIGRDGTIYIGSQSGTVHAINPDGTTKWKNYANDALTSPAIGADSTVYICSYDKSLYRSDMYVPGSSLVKHISIALFKYLIDSFLFPSLILQ